MLASVVVAVICQGSLPAIVDVSSEKQNYKLETFVNAKLSRSKPDVRVPIWELANRN